MSMKYDDVVLGRALQLSQINAALFGQRNVQRQQPHGRAVNGHGCVDFIHGHLIKENGEIVQGIDGYAHLTDFGGHVEAEGRPRDPQDILGGPYWLATLT